MAEKRMFSNKVIGSDTFMEMPDSTQNLYFHLSMYADDDGFVDKWKNIMRMTGKKEDDLKLLISKSFILPFQSGVIVIKDWRINNYLRKDRYSETLYTNEKSQLLINENESYELKKSSWYTTCQPDGSIDKNSIDKINIYSRSENDENKEDDNTNLKCNDIVSTNTNANFQRQKAVTNTNLNEKEVKDIFDFWNDKEIIIHKVITEDISRSITKFLSRYKKDDLLSAIERYSVVLKDTTIKNGKQFFFKYKWSLKDFLTRKGGAIDFLNDGSKWQSYCEWKGIETTENIKKVKTNQVAEGVFKL
jgi:hypothetical protein